MASKDQPAPAQQQQQQQPDLSAPRPGDTTPPPRPFSDWASI